MTVHYSDDAVTLHHGDCLDVLRTLPDCSVDSVVTDPPYGLEFMGKDWDAPWKSAGAVIHDPAAERGGFQDGNGGNPYSRSRIEYGRGGRSSLAFQEWCTEWVTECLRVLKPGGHMVAFGGSRTWHRLASAVEDAGFEIRDSIAWLYGSGFPKSLDVSKAIDKAAGAEREDVYAERDGVTTNTTFGSGLGVGVVERRPVTPEAHQWQGWGTALKPAFEPIVVGRKPLAGTVAANVLAHRTGALNIDGARTAHASAADLAESQSKNRHADFGSGPRENEVYGADGRNRGEGGNYDGTAGRWPTNVLLDVTQADALDRQTGASTSRIGKPRGAAGGDGWRMTATGTEYADSGGASRFFPTFTHDDPEEKPWDCPDCEWEAGELTDTSGCTTHGAPAGGVSSDAEPVRPGTSTDRPLPTFRYEAKAPTSERPRTADGTAHPTVKPLDLMRWLVRLVTPPGGTVLEPFAGSGTTAEACVVEGFQCIAIEREPGYLPLVVQRLEACTQTVLLVPGADL